MSKPIVISLNPLLRHFIAKQYERAFQLPRKKAMSVLITFTNPCQHGKSMYDDVSGVSLEAIVNEHPNIVTTRIVKQAQAIGNVTHGQVVPTPLQVLQLFTVAINEYCSLLASKLNDNCLTYYRRHLDGQVEVVTGSDTFQLALLARIPPGDFHKHFRRLFRDLIPGDLKPAARLSWQYPWQSIIGKQGNYGSRTEVYSRDPLSRIKEGLYRLGWSEDDRAAGPDPVVPGSR